MGNNIFKRSLSLLLCCTMLLSVLPAGVSAEETVSTVESDELFAEGTNGLGVLLSEEIEIAQQEQQSAYDEGYAVVDLTVENGVAIVEYSSMEEANVIVCLYSEDGLQMLASGYTVVDPEQSYTTVTIEGDLPQYFMASAYIADVYDFSPLGAAYTTPMYTQEMQELLSSTVNDYEADRVLNLDENEDTNFAVYEETTRIIKEQEGVNIVASVDDEKKVYTFENANEQLTELHSGDTVAYSYGNNQILLFKVGTLTVDGTTVTIIGTEVELEEIFSHVKIEGNGDTEDMTVDMTEADEGVIHLGKVSEEAPATRLAVEDSTEETYKEEFKVDKTIKEDGEVVDASVNIYAYMQASLTVNFSYYISFTRQQIELKNTFLAELQLEISGEVNVTLPLGSWGFEPIKGVLFIGLKPKLELKFSGSIEYQASIMATVGFSYDGKEGFQNLSTAPKLTDGYEIKASCYIGINLSPQFRLEFPTGIDESYELVTAEITAKFGVRLDAHIQGQILSGPDNQSGSRHSCKDCMSLKFFGVLQFGIQANILGLFNPEKNWDPIEIEFMRRYYSFDYGDSGAGDCPHYDYRTTVQVKNTAGKTLSGALVSLSDGTALGSTNKNGVIVCYLPAGRYSLTASASGNIAKKTITVSGAGSVLLSIGTATNNGVVGVIGTTGSNQYMDEGVAEVGTCGTDVRWTLTNAGTLYIYGSGAMTNYDSNTTSLWYRNTSIKKVVIGNGVTSIGDYAFYECCNLVSVTIPNSVTSIGRCAFVACRKLSGVTIPDSVASIGFGSFQHCTGLTSFTIPDKVSVLQGWTFHGCTGLESVTIGGGLTTIENGAFSTTNLSKIWVDKTNSVYSSDSNGILFNKNKTNLIMVPDGFEGSYSIPDSVTSIDDYAFFSCRNLTSVTIPDSVTNIGDSAFSSCENLASVTIGNGVTSIGEYAFEFCQSLTSMMIPDSVTSIGDYAFAFCESLTWVYFGDGVTSIADGLFLDCNNITTVSIGGSVTSIGTYVFGDCRGLQSIYFRGDAPNIEFSGGLLDCVFLGVEATAYYPAGNSTWTAEVMWKLGIDITWVPYTVKKGENFRSKVAEKNGPSAIEPTQTSEPASKGVFYGDYGAQVTEQYTLKTASFTDLVPGEQYILLAMISMEVENPLVPNNLLYVAQAPALEDGTLQFSYVQRINTEVSYVMACGASNKNLRDAKITFPSMCAAEETAVVDPVVVYEDQVLTQGQDYTLIGTVDYTKAGTYTCYIRGIYQYTGLVQCTYTVLEPQMVDAWNLSLGDNISMNFYMSIEDTAVDSTQLKVTLGEKTVSYSASQAEKDEATGNYIFCVELAAAQITELVTVELVQNGEVVDRKTYSVRQYADYILDENNSFNDDTRALVRQLLHFGAAAQQYFSYRTEALANTGIGESELSPVPETTSPIAVSGIVEGLRFSGASLLFQSKIALRYYFDVDVGIENVVFTIGEKAYTPAEKDGSYYIQIEDIVPQQLDQQITLTATVGTEEVTVTYGPMNYIVRMYHNTENEALKPLLLHLYNYHLVAKKYLNQ
ncbi:MAG: leucine-rich repeat domain-containing protein [Oscillospiraceae bacterium]|nr:leucine-rich repeat domain-containing protein [Oscillospiraceae bacterium]